MIRGLALLALAAVALAVLLPKVSGASWAEIAAVAGSLSALELAALVSVWILSMYVQSFVLTAALPGLTNSRAVLLNLTGSSVSNTLPLGGAVGAGLNYTMIRSWGFDRAAFGLYAVVTNVWDVAAKLTLPALAAAVLISTGQARSPWLMTTALVSTAVLVGVVSLAVAATRREAVVRRVGRGAERAGNAVLGRVRPGRQLRLAEAAARVQARGAGLLRTAWPRLTLGIAAYVAVLFALLWSSLHLLGSTLGVAAVFAGFAVERALTLLVLTPAGTGLAETAAVAVLVALGGDPAVSAAALLLYRGLILGMEVPVGALSLLVWLGRRARSRHDLTCAPRADAGPR